MGRAQLQEARSLHYAEFSGNKKSEQDGARKLRARKLLLFEIINGEDQVFCTHRRRT